MRPSSIKFRIGASSFGAGRHWRWWRGLCRCASRLLLASGRILGQMLVSACFFDGIEIFALDIFDQRHLDGGSSDFTDYDRERASVRRAARPATGFRRRGAGNREPMGRKTRGWMIPLAAIDGRARRALPRGSGSGAGRGSARIRSTSTELPAPWHSAAPALLPPVTAAGNLAAAGSDPTN